MTTSPHVVALTSAVCSAISTALIQRGLRRSNFYAGSWINVAVGTVGLWSAVLLFVPRDGYNLRAVPYFVVSGLVGTGAGRVFRVAAIQKVGASVASSINNLSPLIATIMAILVLGERVTLPILAGTSVIVLGTALLSMSGKQVGFAPRHLIYPFLSASCFGVVAIIRKLGLGHAGPLFDSAVQVTTALVAATAFVLASGNRAALVCDRRSVFYFVTGGIAENTGVFLMIVSLGLGDVSVVTPLAGTAPLFVLGLSFFFPSGIEKLSWRVVAGAMLVVLGVFLLMGGKRLLL